MKIIKHVPNVLSVLRIFISLYMCWLAFSHESRWMFLLMLFVALTTDVWDGFIARKFEVQTKFGSQIDTIADGFMCIGVIVCIVFRFFFHDFTISHYFHWYIIAIGATAFMVYLPLIVCKVRFNQWNKLHLLSYRLLAIPTLLLVVFFAAINHINFWVVLVMCWLVTLAAFEEILTLLVIDEFNADHNGIIGSRLKGGKQVRGKKFGD